MAPADMLAEILRLPPEERARLALELIRSLDMDAIAPVLRRCRLMLPEFDTPMRTTNVHRS